MKNKKTKQRPPVPVVVGNSATGCMVQTEPVSRMALLQRMSSLGRELVAVGQQTGDDTLVDCGYEMAWLLLKTL